MSTTREENKRGREEKKKKKNYKNKSKAIKTLAVGTYISITTLNVNVLNISTKRQILAELIQNLCCIYTLSTRKQFQIQGHVQTQSEGMEKDNSCKWKSKES